ncbi:VCBS repeat-containing protein [Rhodophyticola sp. MJ-SS7]|nr:VCBS repeat-containing protein [Rhodophyticola sp. MJ-SS7]
MEFVSTVSPPEYNRLVWGPEQNHEDAYAAWKSAGWKDAIFFTDSQGRSLSKRIVHSEGFCLHASTLVPANFNNDGIDDVAVLCHGFDAKPFPGEHSFVLLSQSDGSFLSKRLTSRTGFFHGGSVMDVNGDSHLDILALNSFDGSTVAYFGDGAGGFPKSRKLISTGVWQHAISSFDFDNDGDGDLIIGGNEYGGGDTSQDLPTRIYLNNGSGRFSKGNSVTIPGVRGYETVLDFVVSGETLFVLRTNRQYRGGAIQKVDMNTMQQTGLYTRSDAPHPNRLRPVQPRNGQPTFSDLSTSRRHFDFSVGAKNQVLFLN